MKKIIISVIAVLAVALLVSSCTFSVGILPRIGGTTWTYSAEINGVDFRGSLAFGKRTSFSEVDGTLTQTSPIGLTRLFTGAVNKYQLTIAPVSLGEQLQSNLKENSKITKPLLSLSEKPISRMILKRIRSFGKKVPGKVI